VHAVGCYAALCVYSICELGALVHPDKSRQAIVARYCRRLFIRADVHSLPAHDLQVDFFAYTYEQSMPNYKTLQLAFDKVDIRRVRGLAML
jgi:hypothetical protein